MSYDITTQSTSDHHLPFQHPTCSPETKIFINVMQEIDTIIQNEKKFGLQSNIITINYNKYRTQIYYAMTILITFAYTEEPGVKARKLATLQKMATEYEDAINILDKNADIIRLTRKCENNESNCRKHLTSELEISLKINIHGEKHNSVIPEKIEEFFHNLKTSGASLQAKARTIHYFATSLPSEKLEVEEAFFQPEERNPYAHLHNFMQHYDMFFFNLDFLNRLLSHTNIHGFNDIIEQTIYFLFGKLDYHHKNLITSRIFCGEIASSDDYQHSSFYLDHMGSHQRLFYSIDSLYKMTSEDPNFDQQLQKTLSSSMQQATKYALAPANKETTYSSQYTRAFEKFASEIIHFMNLRHQRIIGKHSPEPLKMSPYNIRTALTILILPVGITICFGHEILKKIWNAKLSNKKITGIETTMLKSICAQIFDINQGITSNEFSYINNLEYFNISFKPLNPEIVIKNMRKLLWNQITDEFFGELQNHFANPDDNAKNKIFELVEKSIKIDINSKKIKTRIVAGNFNELYVYLTKQISFKTFANTIVAATIKACNQHFTLINNQICILLNNLREIHKMITDSCSNSDLSNLFAYEKISSKIIIKFDFLKKNNLLLQKYNENNQKVFKQQLNSWLELLESGTDSQKTFAKETKKYWKDALSGNIVTNFEETLNKWHDNVTSNYKIGTFNLEITEWIKENLAKHSAQIKHATRRFNRIKNRFENYLDGKWIIEKNILTEEDFKAFFAIDLNALNQRLSLLNYAINDLQITKATPTFSNYLLYKSALATNKKCAEELQKILNDIIPLATRKNINIRIISSSECYQFKIIHENLPKEIEEWLRKMLMQKIPGLRFVVDSLSEFLCNFSKEKDPLQEIEYFKNYLEQECKLNKTSEEKIIFAIKKYIPIVNTTYNHAVPFKITFFCDTTTLTSPQKKGLQLSLQKHLREHMTYILDNKDGIKIIITCPDPLSQKKNTSSNNFEQRIKDETKDFLQKKLKATIISLKKSTTASTEPLTTYNTNIIHNILKTYHIFAERPLFFYLVTNLSLKKMRPAILKKYAFWSGENPTEEAKQLIAIYNSLNEYSKSKEMLQSDIPLIKMQKIKAYDMATYISDIIKTVLAKLQEIGENQINQRKGKDQENCEKFFEEYKLEVESQLQQIFNFSLTKMNPVDFIQRHSFYEFLEKCLINIWTKSEKNQSLASNIGIEQITKEITTQLVAAVKQYAEQQHQQLIKEKGSVPEKLANLLKILPSIPHIHQKIIILGQISALFDVAPQAIREKYESADKGSLKQVLDQLKNDGSGVTSDEQIKSITSALKQIDLKTKDEDNVLNKLPLPQIISL